METKGKWWEEVDEAVVIYWNATQVKHTHIHTHKQQALLSICLSGRTSTDSVSSLSLSLSLLFFSQLIIALLVPN